MPHHIHIENRTTLAKQLKTFRHILLLILVLLIVMVLVMVFGTMEDLVKGEGTVAGIREYKLKSLVSARTVKILRHEGESVAANEPLVEFDDRNQRDAIKVLKNEVKELELQISVKSKQLELLHADPLPDYYRHTQSELAEARERYARTAKEHEVYTKLFAQKIVTRKEYLDVELAHLANRMAVVRLEEDWKKLQSGMAGQIVAKAEEELRLLRQRLAGKEDEVAMAVRHLEDYIIRAPDAGILTDIPPREGGYFEKGEVVVRFAADQNKKVVALIDEKHIYKVAPGQQVRIYCKQYNYLDYGFFDGKVDVIYQLPVEQNGTLCYPVKILLTREQQPLRFGSSCEVTILTGRERIIFAMLGIRSKDYLKRQVVQMRHKRELKRADGFSKSKQEKKP